MTVPQRAKGAHALQYTETETHGGTQEELIRAGQNNQQERERTKRSIINQQQDTIESCKVKQETTN